MQSFPKTFYVNKILLCSAIIFFSYFRVSKLGSVFSAPWFYFHFFVYIFSAIFVLTFFLSFLFVNLLHYEFICCFFSSSYVRYEWTFSWSGVGANSSFYFWMTSWPSWPFTLFFNLFLYFFGWNVFFGQPLHI